MRLTGRATVAPPAAPGPPSRRPACTPTPGASAAFSLSLEPAVGWKRGASTSSPPSISFRSAGRCGYRLTLTVTLVAAPSPSPLELALALVPRAAQRVHSPAPKAPAAAVTWTVRHDATIGGAWVTPQTPGRIGADGARGATTFLVVEAAGYDAASCGASDQSATAGQLAQVLGSLEPADG